MNGYVAYVKLGYVAYYAANHEYEQFAELETAEAWLREQHDSDVAYEGYTDETLDGQDFIATVTSRSRLNEETGRVTMDS
jgi:viroplasmin and RNaseH domain-containing protein